MHSSNDARTPSNPLPPRTPGAFRIHSRQLPSPSPRSARPRMQHQDMNSAYGLDADVMNLGLPSNFERVQRAKSYLEGFANEIDAIMANSDNDDDILSALEVDPEVVATWTQIRDDGGLALFDQLGMKDNEQIIEKLAKYLNHSKQILDKEVGQFTRYFTTVGDTKTTLITDKVDKRLSLFTYKCNEMTNSRSLCSLGHYVVQVWIKEPSFLSIIVCA